MNEAEQELVHDLAWSVTTTTPFHVLVPDDAAAVERVMATLHKSRCPRCGSKNWDVHDGYRVVCRHRCGVVSAYAGTPWWRRRLKLRQVLAAAHAVFVDVVTPTSRGFHTRTGLRLETSWALLHQMRAALPYFVPAAPGLRRQVLGFCNDANRADVVVSFGSGRLTLTTPDDPVRVGCPEDRDEAERRRAELPIWLGHLRAWLTASFRGVSRHHLWKYLSEFAARHQRVGDRRVSRAAAPCAAR